MSAWEIPFRVLLWGSIFSFPEEGSTILIEAGLSSLNPNFRNALDP